MSTMVTVNELNADERKHQCCCGCCHVVTGTKIFLVLYAIGVVPEILVGLPVSIFGGIIPVLIIVITALGLHKERPGYMWPFIILSGITFVVVVILALLVMIFSIFSAATIVHAMEEINPNFFHRETKYDAAGWLVFPVIVFEMVMVAVMVLAYAQMRVVYRCKQYFEEKQWAGINAVQQHVVQQQQATQSTMLLPQQPHQQKPIMAYAAPSAPPAYSEVMAEEIKKQ